MAKNLYFIGTAGAGKSTLVHTFQVWMNSQGLDCVTVNLDPGAESIPYAPDVDVRDWISLQGVMEEQELGPNAAQVAAGRARLEQLPGPAGSPGPAPDPDGREFLPLVGNSLATRALTRLQAQVLHYRMERVLPVVYLKSFP